MRLFNFEEVNIISICNRETKIGLLKELQKMKDNLLPEEVELKQLIDSTIRKVSDLSQEEYRCYGFFPDF